MSPQSHQVISRVEGRVSRQSGSHPGPVELQEVHPVLSTRDTATPVKVKCPDTQPLLLEDLTDGFGLCGVEEGVVAVLHSKVQQGRVAGQLISQLGL